MWIYSGDLFYSRTHPWWKCSWAIANSLGTPFARWMIHSTAIGILQQFSQPILIFSSLNSTWFREASLRWISILAPNSNGYLNLCKCMLQLLASASLLKFFINTNLWAHLTLAKENLHLFSRETIGCLNWSRTGLSRGSENISTKCSYTFRGSGQHWRSGIKLHQIQGSTHFRCGEWILIFWVQHNHWGIHRMIFR